MIDPKRLEAKVVDLANFAHVGSASDAVASVLDMVLPPAAISITECAINKRMLPGGDGTGFRWLPEKTPYVVGIQDACDEVGVNVVAVQGNARSGKTVAAENLCVRNWIYGPSLNVIWYMQSKTDVDDYVEERVEWMLQNHEEISAKINWKDRRQSRNRKRIGTTLARWLAATASTTRGKASQIIVADEIDGYTAKIRKAILTLLRNRQREFGTAALLYLSSHPDKGPTEGVASVIRAADAIRHTWWTNCMTCLGPMSPSQDTKFRVHWNISKILKQNEGIERADIIELIKRDTRLVCPHCGEQYGENSRRELMARGKWVQPQQTLMEDGTIDGPRRVAVVMGFEIHAMMSPFVTLPELAVEYVTAKWHYDDTQDDSSLREVTIKSLGEVYEGSKEAEKTEDWKVVGRRLKTNYLMGTVPDGVKFLTAFVDVQGDRFEVVVVGWNVAREGWLIDRFPIKQFPGFQGIDPANRLKDWSIIEKAVLEQTYPLQRDPRYHFPIAKVAIDMGGGGADDGDGSVTQNARLWGKSMIMRAKNPVQDWRFLLTKGAASKTGALYGKADRGLLDDQGKKIDGAPWERVFNAFEIKRIIVKRMKIEEEGPGRMHIPIDLADRYIREMTAEHLINGEWISRGRNETWDGWVACEVVRASLYPERDAIDWSKPPLWARPILMEKIESETSAESQMPAHYRRLIKHNNGEG